MSKTNLREEMPKIIEWVDSLRDVFGKAMIDGQIRKGIKGEPTFYARENGHELGTRDMRSTEAVRTGTVGISVSTDPPWMVEARQIAAIREISAAPTDTQLDPESEANALRVIMLNWEGSDG